MTDVIELREYGPRRKDPTAADRQKRFRERKKARKNSVRPIVTPTVVPLPVAQTAVTVPAQAVTVPIRDNSENYNDFKARNGGVTLRQRWRACRSYGHWIRRCRMRCRYRCDQHPGQRVVRS
jgi:hypothetical protein